MHVDSNWPMRSVRLAVVLTAALGVMQGTVRAQDYPSQDIRLICGFPPGSGADVFVRYFADKLRPIAGRTVVVENKVGAASNIATEYVARSKPDGHTLYPFAGTTVAASMHLFKIRPWMLARRSGWRPPPAISHSCSLSTRSRPTRAWPN